ncbi:PAS domain S-box protein [Methanofollis aquaemaris]|uniref:histidine kinase n=1 Tax=Methanofollis aquaemaris TaxID=126734 RepID=A0A8A3S5Y6_9EURY|nr:PAS domain S-box protein [Methanofollis aquaemaris]QSZ67036.1 PAS domain S-box protein [Methanofollis aquaemaris]
MISLLYISENTPTLDEACRCFEDEDDISVITSRSAPAALTMLHNRSFDAIVSACKMAEMDGITLLKILRDAGDLTPFICLTEDDDDETVIQALGNGADLCICRKSDPTTLSKKILALVAGRKKIHPCRDQICRFLPKNTAADTPSGDPKRAEPSLLTARQEGRERETGKVGKEQNGGVDPSRECSDILQIFRDISGPDDPDNPFRESERFYTSLIDSLLDGIVIIDLCGRIIYANQAAREIGGNTSFKGEEESVFAFISPGYIGTVKECLQRCRTEDHTFSFECPARTCRGEKKEIEVLGSTIAYQGNRGLTISFRDITERKKAEKALKEAEKNKQNLLQGFPEYIIVYSDTRGVIYANPAAEAALGKHPDKITGKPVLSLVMEDFREIFEGVVADSLSGNQSMPQEIMLKTPDNTPLPVTVRATSITYQDEDAVLLVLTDITERLVLEKEMEYYAAELKHFTESLARINDKLTIMGSITRHDILNQLTVLLAHLEMAEEEKAEDPAFLTHLRPIHKAATNIQEQIEFTRDYQDIGIRAPQWCIMERMVVRLKPRTITIQSEVRGVEVYADPLFERVLFNLLDNAERHGGEVSTIRISCREEEHGLVILWEDDGTGIKEQEKEKIFKRGYGKNTGFGLFLCREILSITGIEIRETGKYGKGARFEILVPEEGYQMERDPTGAPHHPTQA